MQRTRLEWRAVGLVLAIVAAVHVAVLNRYGMHRDEFYYVITGRRLAWGYPDQPPLTSLLARMLHNLGGLTGLRLGAVAAHLGFVLLAGLLTAEFGGRRRAQVLAVAASAVFPIFLGSASFFGTTVTDQVMWALVTLLAVRAVRRPTVWRWLVVGFAAGVGLENKQTIVVLVGALFAGLAVAKRDALRVPGPWLAGGIALAMWLPNLDWDATHRWANIGMAKRLAQKSGGPIGSGLMVFGLLVLSPVVLVVAWAGVRRLWTTERWLVVAVIVTVGVFTLSGGKAYYPMPILVVLIAAGSIAVDERSDGTSLSRGWVVSLTASLVAGALVSLPVLPATAASALRPVNPVLVDTYGWRQLTAEIAAAAQQAPRATVVFASNYGEAGAVKFYGPDLGLNLPIVSGHNAYWYWGPPKGSDASVLAVGEFDAAYLRRFWRDVTRLAPFTLADGIDNEETANDGAIYLCEQPRGSWTQLWPRLRHLD